MRTKIMALVAVIAICAGGYLYKDDIMGFIGLNEPQEEIFDETMNIAPIDNINTAPSVANANNTNTSQNTGDYVITSSPSSPAGILNSSCLNGVMKDCVALANLYLEGSSVEKDTIKAVNILIKPCEDENADACALLSRIYDKGLGVAQSVYLYLGYANKACNFGDIDICYDLGVKYYRGNGQFMPKDVMKAFYLFKKTCDKGKLEGCNNLAVIYNNGKNGVPKNLTLAKSLFEDACKNGYKPSCENLKKIFPN